MTKHAEIAARLAAATPGPWFRDDDSIRSDNAGSPDGVAITLKQERDWADADFIAHAPSDIAFLLDENRGLREAAHVGVELDNHHNAAMCPYCQAPLATAEAEVATLRDLYGAAVLRLQELGESTVALATPTATAREES